MSELSIPNCPTCRRSEYIAEHGTFDPRYCTTRSVLSPNAVLETAAGKAGQTRYPHLCPL